MMHSTLSKKSARGFTLIEMGVVTLVLLLLAALITPNIVSMQKNEASRNFYRQVNRLLMRAHSEAITSGQTHIITIDEGLSQVVLAKESASTQTGSDPRQVSNNDTPQTDTVASVSIPSGVRASSLTLNSNASSSSDWQLHFYADGKADDAGLELTEGNATRSFSVDKRGLISTMDGNLPDSSTNTWTAGTYEQRTTS